MMVGLVLVCSRVLPGNTFIQCLSDNVHTCPRTFLDGDSTCGSFRFHHKVTYGEGYRGHCRELKYGPLRSNLVRSAHAAYETFCKLESEYPLTVLATPPLQNDSATTKPPFATTKPLPSSLSPLPSHYQALFGHYQATTKPSLATTKPLPSALEGESSGW